MAEVRVAKEDRTQVRRAATIDLKSAQSHAEVDAVNFKDLSILLARLKQHRSDLLELDRFVNQSVASDDTALADAVERSRLYQTDLSNAIYALEFSLASFHAQQAAAAQPTTAPPLAQMQSQVVAGSQSRGVRHRALDVDVVKFNGDPAHWEEFFDDFKATVDQKSHYTPVEKLKILKASLEGEAQGVLKGFLLTDANYEQAKQALEERYANKQLRRLAHFEALLAVPPADHQTARLVEMRDECEGHIRSLVALGMDEDQFGEAFVFVLLSKLPKFVRLEVTRNKGDTDFTLPGLRKLLKNEIEIRETCERIAGSERDHKPKRKAQRKKSPELKSTASTLVTSSGAKSKMKQCVFCQGAHESQNCTVYPDVASRRKQLPRSCYSCLESGHITKRCPNRKSCGSCGRRGHHLSLCFDKYPPKTAHSEPPHKGSVQLVSNQNSHVTNQAPGGSVHVVATERQKGRAILETATATIRGSRSEITARVIFDTASTLSFVTTKLAKKAGATMVGEEVTSVGRFRDKKRSTSVYRLYELDIVLPGGSIKRIVANSVDVISTPVQLVPIAATHRTVLSSVALAEPLVDVPGTVEVDILIGLDSYHAFFEDAQIRLTDELVLKKSVFGWIPSGFQRGKPTDGEDNVHVILRVEGRMAEFFDVEKFWVLDEIGIRDDPGSVDDEVALEFFNETIKFEEGRYHVKWPFRDPHPNLPTNQSVALRRLKSLWSKLKDQPQMLSAYDKVITDQLSSKIIEAAPLEPDRLEHYLPHHGVVKESTASTKLRVVYDASAKASRDSLSLNDCLYRGPVMMSDLCGILLRTRLHPVGILSDVEKAYLQVGLQLEDRDVTRFYWFKDVSKGFREDNIVCYRFRRVLFGVRPSAFMLAGTLAVHIRRSDKSVAKQLDGNIYVDNAFNGQSTVESALQFYRDAKQLLSEASMNLREWFSNSVSFMESIPEMDRGKGDVAQLLGITWHLPKDELSTLSKLKDTQQPATKRSVLKTIAAVYDPCGWFCPVLIAGKFLMQDLWLCKTDWDTEIPEELRDRWHSIWQNILGISEIRIPRCVDSRASLPDSVVELHTFCDASARAYAAATYIRVERDGKATVNLLFAKGRISPASKQLTIPRLELVGAVVGVRLQSFVAKELHLPVTRQVIWIDSKCVLHWLNSKAVQTVFVENRLREIRRLQDQMEFRYTPTSDNPADLPTRGLDVESLRKSTLWWNGPSWLLESDSEWPANIEVSEKLLDESTESVIIPRVGANVDDKVFDIERYSSLSRLLRVTAWVFRFVDRLRGRKTPDPCITAADMAKAEQFWVKTIQRETLPGYFGGEMTKELRHEATQLGLFVDPQGVVRCQGRLDHAELTEDQQRPIYIPRKHSFATLVVRRAHTRKFHSGAASTLAEVRSRYWIPSGRVLTKRVIRECTRCRRVAGGPFAIPNPPPLPPERVLATDPFAVSGIDYVGPLHVAQGDKPAKVWIALFTCAVIRAIHLEVAESLSAADFILCLRRFVAARGAPKIVISDNAKQFRLSSKLLANDWAKVVAGDEVQGFCSESGIAWKFVPEMSPWMGGFYERLVRPVRDALKRALGPKLVTLKELYTLLPEIAMVINRRPITYMETEAGDRPLRPLDFLRHSGTSLSTPSPDLPAVRGSTAEDLVKQWKSGQNRLERCWSEFRAKYLLNLRKQYSKHENRNSSSRLPKVGMVVLVKDDQPRLRWRIGRIIALRPSRDNVCRSVELRLGNGNTIVRPVKLLYPLECSGEAENVNDVDENPREVALQKRVQAAKERAKPAEEDSDSEGSIEY